MSLPANSYEYKDRWVLLRVPRCLLVFTKNEWIRAIRRGKSWRRHGGEKLRGEKLRGHCD
jgi:uncharacterized C2H2 Zn-finger protein